MDDKEARGVLRLHFGPRGVFVVVVVVVVTLGDGGCAKVAGVVLSKRLLSRVKETRSLDVRRQRCRSALDQGKMLAGSGRVVDKEGTRWEERHGRKTWGPLGLGFG